MIINKFPIHKWQVKLQSEWAKMQQPKWAQEHLLANLATDWRLVSSTVFTHVTTDEAAEHFLLYLLKLGSAGKRCIVEDPNDLHTILSDEEYEEHLSWIEKNLGAIRGTESGLLLKFTPGHYEKFSPDRWKSALGLTRWICDCWGNNVGMGASSATARLLFVKTLSDYPPWWIVKP